jgi:hypothetical protein
MNLSLAHLISSLLLDSALLRPFFGSECKPDLRTCSRRSSEAMK